MISTSRFPKVSFIIPTLNDAKRLKECLSSIKKQIYPKNKIEIIVIDDKSIDNTIEVAKSFNTRIVISGKHDLYRSLAIGLHIATGEFVYQIDQDVEIRTKDFLQKMLRPLLDDPTMTGSFTRYYPNKKQSWISRFLSYDPALLDPVYEFFSPPLEKLIIKKKTDYFVCDYSSKKIPPFTMMLYRLRFLKKNPLWNNERFYDHETVMAMINSGYTKFAYVPAAGLYHDHADNLLHLIKKRIRNLKGHYLVADSPYKYRWFDTSSWEGVFKILFWIIYANLFVPEAIRGIMKAIKFHDPVFLAQPVITITLTDVLLFNFLTLPQGRTFIKKSFGWIFGQSLKESF